MLQPRDLPPPSKKAIMQSYRDDWRSLGCKAISVYVPMDQATEVEAALNKRTGLYLMDLSQSNAPQLHSIMAHRNRKVIPTRELTLALEMKIKASGRKQLDQRFQALETCVKKYYVELLYTNAPPDDATTERLAEAFAFCYAASVYINAEFELLAMEAA